MARPGVRTDFVARVLGALESRKLAPNVPASWYGPAGFVPRDEIPFASGIGYASSPFSSYYEKAWGVVPGADQARYRIIYRTVPIAHAAVDKLVESATVKGFSLDVDETNPMHNRIREICKDWIRAHPELATVLQTAAKDLLIHGTAYIEPCYAETGFDIVKVEENGTVQFNSKAVSNLTENERTAFDKLANDWRDMKAAGAFHRFPRYHPAFIQGMEAQQKVPVGLYENPVTMETNGTREVAVLSRGTKRDAENGPTSSPLVWLKNLDFLTMRVRRDAWGNIFGAIQYLAVPPVAFDTSKIVVGTWSPTSTFYESAYGVSLFQSLIRTQEAIWQIENDLLIIGHALAKPPHLFRNGLVDKTTGRLLGQPHPTDWVAFQGRMAQRTAGSDLYLPPHVGAEPINQALQASVSALIAYLQYHHTMRVIALKVPPQLLGVPEGSSRTTAQVNQGDYVLTVQSLQSSLGRMLTDIMCSVLEPFRAELGEFFEPPVVKWNPIMERDETVELDKIMKARSAGLLTKAEARRLLVERGIFEVPIEGEHGYEESMRELEGEAMAEQEAQRERFENGNGFEKDKKEAAAATVPSRRRRGA